MELEIWDANQNNVLSISSRACALCEYAYKSNERLTINKKQIEITLELRARIWPLRLHRPLRWPAVSLVAKCRWAAINISHLWKIPMFGVQHKCAKQTHELPKHQRTHTHTHISNTQHKRHNIKTTTHVKLN